MFAIIKTGGKQYKVAANEIIKIEKLDVPPGESIEFSNVLVVGQDKAIKIGAPFVPNAKVHGTVVDQIRDDKVLIFKKKRRHNYRRKNGHRQYLTVVRITDILPEGGAPKVKAVPAKAKEMVTEEAKAPQKKAAPKAEKSKKEEAPKPKASVKKAAPKATKPSKK